VSLETYLSAYQLVNFDGDAPADGDMKRANQVFHFEDRASDSPFVEKIWRTRSEPAPSFISVAVSHWELVVARQYGRTFLTVRGPETKATTSPVPEDAEFFGIQFKHGAFMPSFPLDRLVDGSIPLPGTISTTFRINGSAWDFPDYDNADLFVSRLVREGLLVWDPVVEAALQGQVRDRSVRSVQRRFVRATGLTQGVIRQIARAERAVELLEQGTPILETVARAGYADQAHLTRALRRFIGQTPAQIAATDASK
jgi:AraC-like DNA-binding protein